jgi:iron complex outermembrane receptor protein
MKKRVNARAVPRLAVAAIVVAALSLQPALLAQRPAADLKRLTLEQLLEVEVSTASRGAEPWWRTMSATTVLTHDDIRRSGASTLVELLRLVPGVHVAQIDTNKFAVGIRGFTDRLSRAMLVLIDGRAVYSPLFAGTYWEAQDTLLEDIERIEVIRGPGGTLWGANAVNGIVNIITKPAGQTRGGYVTGRGGNVEHGLVGVRYGARAGTSDYRVYAKAFDRGAQARVSGAEFDEWSGVQAGFRVDRDTTAGGHITMQGDLYTADAGQRINVNTYAAPFTRTSDAPAEIWGANVLARWRRQPASTSLIAHAYYDTTSRVEAAFSERRHTVELDVQQGAVPWRRHALLWGAAYRVTRDDTSAIGIRGFTPENRTQQIFSGFFQDQVAVVPDRVELVAGAKVEHNSFSGFEVQPSARVLWTPHVHHAMTASVARAVRTPSRVEIDYVTGQVLDPRIPLFLRLQPNDDFESEKLIAYEIGYRTRPRPSVLLTVNGFVNHHRDTLSAVIGTVFAESAPPPPHLIAPVQFQNGLHGLSHGVEVSSDVRLSGRTRITTGYSWLRVQLTRDPDEPPDASQERRGEGGSPRHQVFNTLAVDLPGHVELDWMFRYVGRLPAVNVPAYHTSDVRLAWNATPRLSLALVGRNLHEARHLEFIGATPAGNSEIRRSVSAGATWRW